MAIFHYTIKIVGRSKGKSVISAYAYLNGDVMKNEETGRISYYTSKKEVVYTRRKYKTLSKICPIQKIRR